MFKDEIKALLIEYGLEKEIQQLDKYLTEYKARFVQRMIPVPNNTKELLGQNSIYYIQLALCRSKLLIDGVITAINDKNSLLAMLAARAHFEVTGALAYLLKKINNYYNKEITFENLDQSLRRLILGTKTEESLGDTPEPINVMSLIDAADDYFKSTKTESQRTHRESYSLLSEFCHPNFHGITMQGEINENGVVQYNFNPQLEKRDMVFLSFLLMSISCFLILYDNIFNLLEKEEKLPKLI